MGEKRDNLFPRPMGNDMNKGNRRREITHIREVVEAIFAAPGCPVDLEDMKLWKLWDGLVGPEVASHARPSSIKRGTLVVKVSDSVWLQDLEFRAYEIRERINGALQREAVRKIRFRVGEPKGGPGVS
jgi:predicted nucleic acid-binding Zn ribbon protein